MARLAKLEQQIAALKEVVKKEVVKREYDDKHEEDAEAAIILPENVYGGMISAVFEAFRTGNWGLLIQPTLNLGLLYNLQYQVLIWVSRVVDEKLGDEPDLLLPQAFEDAHCSLFLTLFSLNLFGAAKDWMIGVVAIFRGHHLESSRGQGREAVGSGPSGLLAYPSRAGLLFRALLFLVISVPEGMCYVLLLFIGSQYLTVSSSMEDLVLNCVALTFVAELDEWIWRASPNKKDIETLTTRPPASRESNRTSGEGYSAVHEDERDLLVDDGAATGASTDDHNGTKKTIVMVMGVLYYAFVTSWPWIFKQYLRVRPLGITGLVEAFWRGSDYPLDWVQWIFFVGSLACMLLLLLRIKGKDHDQKFRRAFRTVLGAIVLLLLFAFMRVVPSVNVVHEGTSIYNRIDPPEGLQWDAWKSPARVCPSGLTPCELKSDLCVDLFGHASPVDSAYARTCPVEASSKSCADVGPIPGWSTLSARERDVPTFCAGPVNGSSAAALHARFACTAIGARLCRPHELMASGLKGWASEPCEVATGNNSRGKGHWFWDGTTWKCRVLPLEHKAIGTCCADAHKMSWPCAQDLPHLSCDDSCSELPGSHCLPVPLLGNYSFLPHWGTARVCTCKKTMCAKFDKDYELDAKCVMPTESMLLEHASFRLVRWRQECKEFTLAPDFADVGLRSTLAGCALAARAWNMSAFLYSDGDSSCKLMDSLEHCVKWVHSHTSIYRLTGPPEVK